MIERATEAVRDYQQGHTPFQIERFMLGSAFTTYGKWRQCQREIASRLDSIRKSDPVAVKEAETLLRLESELREQVEGMDYEALEEREWYYRVKRELGLDFLIDGRPSRSTVSTMLLLPQPQRDELLGLMADASQRKGLLEWVTNGSEVSDGLPEQLPG